jgi:two-component system sensor histidine kinase/response regulator
MQAEPTQGRILIVDDVAANVRLLAGILKIEGYETVTATSGPDALERARDSAPDVILLDVMMPGMDGFEVCRFLRADEVTAHIPIVIVTALQSTEDRVRALENGADDFLSKPVDGVEVVARVRSLVRAKRGRDELSNAYAELKRSESLRDNLTVMLVHDLRTPLTTLIGPLEMLLAKNSGFGELTEMQKEILSLSTRSGYRLLGLVNELLDISKLENGELRPDRSPLDITALVKEALDGGALVGYDHSLELLSDVAPDLPFISADDDLLRRVLSNIVGNAIKFTPGPGTITIGARLQDTHEAEPTSMLFFVADTGPGISETDRLRIFDKFGQVDMRKEGRNISTGLGLTFCKLAIEAHGGRIWVESELEKGSTFFFALPLTSE